MCVSMPLEQIARATIQESAEIQIMVKYSTRTLKIHTEYESGEYYVDFPIYLKHVTDYKNYTSVIINLDNLTCLKADIYLGETVVTGKAVTLRPNEYRKVTVKVFAEEHDYAGNYSITFEVKDELSHNLLNSTVLTTVVAQYYDIELVKLPSMTYSRIVDPNAMTGDIQTEVFEIKLHNYGNGPDTVNLSCLENRLSPEPIPLTWADTLMDFYEKYGGVDPINEITVPSYDKVAGLPGEVALVININIPKGEYEGKFIIDLWATSSASRRYINGLQRKDLEYESNATFEIIMVLPEIYINVDESMLKKYGMKLIDEYPIYINERINFSIVVSNSGSAPATDVKIKFSASKDQVEQQSKKDEFTVEAGETIILFWQFTPIEEGYYTLKAVIDPDGELLGDLPNNNVWSKFKKVEEKTEETHTPLIDITTNDYEKYDIGDTIVIKGKWYNSDYYVLQMWVRITYPDNTKSEYMLLSDIDSAEESNASRFIEFGLDYSWKFIYKTEGAISDEDGGRYIFTFQAKAKIPDNVYAVTYTSNEEQIYVFIGTNDSQGYGGKIIEKEENPPVYMGLFSYDILVNVLILIILAFIIIITILFKRKSKPPKATPSLVPPSSS
ncbi:MAG: hypothetical protein JSV49_02145 [Thermoplasmata archaeon]|nr:MAG: hypothetical protein JSV49_02145 [Thermoplasmata archaeon]